MRIKVLLSIFVCLCLGFGIIYFKQDDKKENLFDIDLFQFKVSNEKISNLKEKIEEDESLRYIVSAIKHAVGVES